ncbi:MAG: VCBS repeat-containing protein [Bacteroidota bacterium]
MQKQGELCSENKLFVVLCVLNFLLVGDSAAQVRDIHSIGLLQKSELPVPVKFPILLKHSSVKYPDLVYYHTDSSTVEILRNNGHGTFADAKIIVHTSAVTSVTTGNINNDGIDDIILVHRDQNQIEVLLSSIKDSAYTSSLYPVHFYPEHAIIGDLTNDKVPDIISYGKLSSGISVLQGKGNGKFNPFKILFENIPVSECALIALNGDNIPDIAIHNWLTNETTIHLGLGRFKFSEQTVLSFSQDTVQTLFSDFNNDAIADVAVLSIQNNTLQILDGDGLGNFAFAQSLPLYALSHSISQGSFSRLQSRDIVIYKNAENIFSLLLNRSNGTFYDEIVFGSALPAPELLAGDLNGDGMDDIMLVDGVNKKYSIVWNSSGMADGNDSVRSYAVGINPNNVFVTDLTNDGNDDVIVNNNGSSTISVLISRGTSFSGQVSIETPENPLAVSLYAKTDSSITFYTTHQDDPKVSLISLRKEIDSANTLAGDIEQYSIALPEKPVNVLPDASFMQKGISLYAFMSTAPNAIVFYQQVKGTRFLAKSLVPVIPSKIVYSTINDLNGDGKTDLLYVYSDEASRGYSLGVTLNDSAGEFKGKVFSFALPDTSIRKAMLFIDDFNGDQFKDCLMYLAPANQLRLTLGKSESVFSEFKTIASDVRIKLPEQLQVYDSDNDGNLDILYHHQEREELFLYRGKGNGTFMRGSIVSSVPAGSVFRCGDFNGDGIADIIFTNPKSNSVTVKYDFQK